MKTKTKTVGGSPANLRPITLNNPCSILKEKKPALHFTFMRFSTMDHFFCMLTRCLIALKFSKNAPISKLFSFLIYDFSLLSYVLCVSRAYSIFTLDIYHPLLLNPVFLARALFCISGKHRCHMDDFSAKFYPAGLPDIRWRQRIGFVERKRLDLF